MTDKGNITVGDLQSWDNYTKSDLTAALKSIYEDAGKSSKSARDWYWHSICAKRTTSLWIRGLTFAFLVCGALLPLIAAVLPDQYRLAATQLGVVTLAFAGLLQAADKVFGWSSGWLRYITTVTAMEAADPACGRASFGCISMLAMGNKLARYEYRAADEQTCVARSDPDREVVDQPARMAAVRFGRSLAACSFELRG